MLTKFTNQDFLRDALLPNDSFKALPKASNREAWEGLLPEDKERFISEGEKYLGFNFYCIPATTYLKVHRGLKDTYAEEQKPLKIALGSLVIAECIEHKGRFIDDIINGVWCYCEQSVWTHPFHNYQYDPEAGLPDLNDIFVDLESGTAASKLAWTYYLLKQELDTVCPNVCKRIEHEIFRQIINPYMKNTHYWWMGFDEDQKVNNWNPWINSNILLCAFVIIKDNDERVKIVSKIIKSINSFYKLYEDKPDGCCDEGPNYWGFAAACGMEALEMLYDMSDGKISIFDEPLFKKMGEYIYKVHISESYYMNFADAGVKSGINTDLAYRYGVRSGDEVLKQQAIAAHHLNPDKFGLYSWLPLGRSISHIFHHKLFSSTHKKFPLIRDGWMEYTHVMSAREKAGTDKGIFVAAKGGCNAESHNHNDVGHFMIYSDGRPVIIDCGSGLYTQKYFSDKRHEVWITQSHYHNVPSINGEMQQAGIDCKATNVNYKCDVSSTTLSMDISTAYPKETGVNKLVREITLNRSENAFVTVSDKFEFQNPFDEYYLNLMTCCKHEIDSGKILFSVDEANDVQLEYDEDVFIALIENISEIHSEDLVNNWGETNIYRIRFKLKENNKSGNYTIKFSQII